MITMFFHTKGLTLEDAEFAGNQLAEEQFTVNWKIGDLARYAKDVLKLGDNYSQVFPEWMSVGLIQRCEAVARAYPTEESRNPLATWSIHMREASRPDRIKRVQDHVDAGHTSDEAAKSNREQNSNRPKWLIAFDTHYFAHRHYYSGAGVETAMQVAEWIRRTVERLREKGATDCVCAFEGKASFRKELTADPSWDGGIYKDRPSKPEDLKHQLNLVREILEGFGFCCVSIDGFEADDVLASYAKQFDGRTTIVSSDKDLRSCLSDTCNMLLDVSWIEDETSGQHLPSYKWLSAKQHTEATGIPPSQWVEYQTLMGDATDGIKGVPGVGEKGAADLIKQFKTVEAVIEAAKAGDESIREKKREALIAFESKAEVTRQLVTLVDSLEVPNTTRI